MLKTVRVKLLPTQDQKKTLLSTMKEVNRACDSISEFAFQNKVFNRFELQKQIYRSVRSEHRLSAQMVIRAIAKVVDSYRTSIAKKENLTLHTYHPRGAIAYDSRIYSIKDKMLSIWTIDGRIKIPIQTKYTLKNDREADLWYDRTKNRFYLNVLVDVQEEPTYDPISYLGIDLGIVNIVATNDGTQVPGTDCDRVRQWYQDRKRILQNVGTKSAKRRLKQLSNGESRFKKNVNHIISKNLVAIAKDTHRGIALEDLTHIRERTTKTVRRSQRDRHTKWAFAQLRTFIEYKAAISGVPVVFVDPAYTSQMCSVCGHIDKENRKTRDAFSCVACGHTESADINAAKNIACRAAVNQPMVAETPLVLLAASLPL